MKRLSKEELMIVRNAAQACDVAHECPPWRRDKCQHNNPAFTKLLGKYGRKELVDQENDQHVYCNLGTMTI